MPHDSEQHAQHDPLLVVSFAAGDLTGADRDLAASLITNCGQCAALNDDLAAIARATAAIPPAARVRDFRLTPEQAARLRPGGWRRFAAALASPRLAMTRQLGVGLTTLGLAGLLVSVLPSVQLGSSAGAAPAGHEALSASDGFSGSGAEAGSSAAPSAAAAAATPDPDSVVRPAASDAIMAPFASGPPVRASTDGKGTNGAVTAQGPDADASAAAQRQFADQVGVDGPGVSLVVIASAILLAAGIALLLARRIARGLTGG